MTRATTFRTTAVIGGLLLAMLMIMTVSRAAFSDVTSNDDNSVAAGSVVLYNDAPNGGAGTGSAGDESGDPMFGTEAEALASAWTVRADNLKPGETVSHCIEIIYGGTLDANAVLQSISVTPSTTAGFEDEINMTVERFNGACGAAGTGTAAVAGGATLGAFTINDPVWPATTGDSQFYLVELELDTAVANSFQGASVSDIDFQWYAENQP